MTAPVLTYSLLSDKPHGFAELSGVRLLRAVVTDDGKAVPQGTEGTVVGIWAEGAAYEVEFSIGLATVEASCLEAA
jgi:hypothetical protein